MKTFKFKWKSGDNIYIGEHKFETEEQLRNHIKRLNGELIEIYKNNNSPFGTTDDAMYDD